MKSDSDFGRERGPKESYFGLLDMIQHFRGLREAGTCPMSMYVPRGVYKIFEAAQVLEENKICLLQLNGITVVESPSMPRNMIGVIPADGDPKKFKLIVLEGLG